MIWEWIRFLLGSGFLIWGVVTFMIEVFGVFKFKYVLNRMQVAATGDTLGLGLSLLGLMILFGFRFVTLKLGLIIVFLWCASPVSTHLISRLEYTINENVGQYCKIRLGNEKDKNIDSITAKNADIDINSIDINNIDINKNEGKNVIREEKE